MVEHLRHVEGSLDFDGSSDGEIDFESIFGD